MSDRKALVAALALIDDLRSYCRDSWDWKYGDQWDAETAAIKIAADRERETLKTILDLINPLHDSLDKQTYDERLRDNFDAPPDAEYAVNITAQQERDLTQAVCILESRLGLSGALIPAPLRLNSERGGAL